MDDGDGAAALPRLMPDEAVSRAGPADCHPPRLLVSVAHPSDDKVDVVAQPDWLMIEHAHPSQRATEEIAAANIERGDLPGTDEVGVASDVLAHRGRCRAP